MDISYDWLVVAYGKVRVVEYALIWLSFASILWLGLEGGIGLGCLLAAVQFTWEYAQLSGSSITVVPSLSSIMRTYDQRRVLEILQVTSPLLAVSALTRSLGQPSLALALFSLRRDRSSVFHSRGTFSLARH